LVFLCVEILEILPGWVAHCLLVFFSPLENRLFFKALMIRRISFFFLRGLGYFLRATKRGATFGKRRRTALSLAWWDFL